MMTVFTKVACVSGWKDTLSVRLYLLFTVATVMKTNSLLTQDLHFKGAFGC